MSRLWLFDLLTIGLPAALPTAKLVKFLTKLRDQREQATVAER